MAIKKFNLTKSERLNFHEALVNLADSFDEIMLEDEFLD